MKGVVICGSSPHHVSESRSAGSHIKCPKSLKQQADGIGTGTAEGGGCYKKQFIRYKEAVVELRSYEEVVPLCNVPFTHRRLSVNSFQLKHMRAIGLVKTMRYAATRKRRIMIL